MGGAHMLPLPKTTSFPKTTSLSLYSPQDPNPPPFNLPKSSYRRPPRLPPPRPRAPPPPPAFSVARHDLFTTRLYVRERRYRPCLLQPAPTLFAARLHVCERRHRPHLSNPDLPPSAPCFAGDDAISSAETPATHATSTPFFSCHQSHSSP